MGSKNALTSRPPTTAGSMESPSYSSRILSLSRYTTLMRTSCSSRYRATGAVAQPTATKSKVTRVSRLKASPQCSGDRAPGRRSRYGFTRKPAWFLFCVLCGLAISTRQRFGDHRRFSLLLQANHSFVSHSPNACSSECPPWGATGSVPSSVHIAKARPPPRLAVPGSGLSLDTSTTARNSSPKLIFRHI